MRRRIDMSEVEAATKIRAKYLRALENEGWDLLPGPTFVKTFLRTYAEYLNLDPRLLVEEYRQRYERPSTQDLTPFGPLGAQRRRRRRSPLAGPIFGVVVIVVALLGALYALGKWGENDEKGAGAGPAQPTATATATPRPKRSSRKRKKPAPTVVSLRLTAVRAVYVCLEDARGRRVINGATLQPGQRTRTLRSKRFRANFGNAGIRVQVNGRSYSLAESSDPIGYEMRPGKRPRRLPESVRQRLCA